MLGVPKSRGKRRKLSGVGSIQLAEVLVPRNSRKNVPRAWQLIEK